MIDWFKKSSLVKFLGTFLILCVIFGVTIHFTKVYFNGAFENKENYYLAISQVLGGILGGLFTLIGVWWTLIIQKKEKKEDLIQSEKRQSEQNRLQNLPVFQYNTDNILKQTSGTVHNINCKDSDEKIEIPLNIYMKNIGFGAAQHIYYQLFIGNNYQSFKEGKGNSLIKPNETAEYNCYIYVRKQEENLSATLIVYYDDLIGNHYMQELDGSLSKCYSINSDTNEEKENFYISFSNTKNYMIIDDNYTYKIPEETIDIYNENKKNYENMQKYSKLECYEEITSLVQNFTDKNREKIFEYLPHIYRKINILGRGGGIINIEENIKKNEYIITLFVSTTQSSNCELTYNVLLNINLDSKKIYLDKVKLIKNTIKVNGFIHFLAAIELHLYMHRQKKKINKMKTKN